MQESLQDNIRSLVATELQRIIFPMMEAAFTPLVDNLNERMTALEVRPLAIDGIDDSEGFEDDT